jgi:hypothetical protein
MASITPEMIQADNALARFVVLDSRTVPPDVSGELSALLARWLHG